MMMPPPCPSGSRLLKTFSKFSIIVSKLKIQNSQSFQPFVETMAFFLLFIVLQKQTLSINAWKLREFWIFNFETIILNLEKVFSNLEPEGQGGGIIMGVTRLLLLGLFYYIQTNFSILFCTRLYTLVQCQTQKNQVLKNFTLHMRNNHRVNLNKIL